MLNLAFQTALQMVSQLVLQMVLQWVVQLAAPMMLDDKWECLWGTGTLVVVAEPGPTNLHLQQHYSLVFYHGDHR